MLDAHGEGHALAIEGRLLAEEALPMPDHEALLGVRVGPYRVKALIGRGGMGAVYLAERADGQYHQDVALKLIRPGFQTVDLLRRFRAERQILARLMHDNVARLLDGGMTDDGQPYLVMEYVDGVPITQFCDVRRLAVDARLHLFRTVCAAVQFAHRNLVVHRDLKPSNILVTERGEVKLLDFGIAKLQDPEAVGLSVALTRSEVRVMTPEYAAPEQVRGEAITTTTDVYALGVLLYELLTGHRPYRLPGNLPAEVERIICEEEPTRPSTVVAAIEEIPKPDGTTETLTPERVSAARATQAARLRRILQGDLDNVVMMALRKEPERRYASVEQLAEDIRLYLAGRPVIARKDTFSYRLRTFVRRNRVGMTVAAAFVLLLVGFSAVTAWQARRVVRERDMAQQAAQQAEQVTAFMLGLFESAAPVTAPRDTMRVRDVLEAGAARTEALAGQPAVQAQLFTVLSQAYWHLGRPDRAALLAGQALHLRRQLYGVRHPETASSIYWLGVLRQELNQYDEALALYRESLDAHRALYGDDHRSVVKGIYRIDHVLHLGGRGQEADSLFEQWQHTLQQVPTEDDPDLATMLGTMGAFLQYKGRLDEAEAYVRRALAMKRRLYGDGDFRIGDEMNTLVNVLIAQHRAAEAETVAREALALNRGLYPEGSLGLARSLDALGETLLEQGRYGEAEPYLSPTSCTGFVSPRPPGAGTCTSPGRPAARRHHARPTPPDTSLPAGPRRGASGCGGPAGHRS